MSFTVCSHFFFTACRTFSPSTEGQNELRSWVPVSNQIIPKWCCEIVAWEKVPLVRHLIPFPRLPKSHTIKEKWRRSIYLFEMCCLVTGGWKSATRELSDVPVCAPITSTWDTSCLSRLWFGRTVKGGELKEQTRRRQPLTDLTSVIGALRCQHASQIKTNGAYPGYWRLASLGPISSAPVNVHRERLIEHPSVPSRRTHRRIQIGSRATGRGGVITGAAGLGDR